MGGDESAGAGRSANTSDNACNVMHGYVEPNADRPLRPMAAGQPEPHLAETPQPRPAQRLRFSRTTRPSFACGTNWPILADGDFTPLLAGDPHVWAYTRTTPGQRNCSWSPTADAIRGPSDIGRDIGADWMRASLLLGNLPDTPVGRRRRRPSTWPAGNARIYSAGRA